MLECRSGLYKSALRSTRCGICCSRPSNVFSNMKVWAKKRLLAFLLFSSVFLHVKHSYEFSECEEEREDGEALLVPWLPSADALSISRKQWRKKKRKFLTVASRTKDTIATASRCGLFCIASLTICIHILLVVLAGDVELNPGPEARHGEYARIIVP